MLLSQVQENTKARILIVDNDDETRELLRDRLLLAGYQVAVAEGVGDELIQSAIIIGRDFWPHVAIIDLRIGGSALFDSLRTNDRGGLRLIPHLSSAHCILRSGHLTTRVHREAIREYGASNVVAAEEPLEDLLQVVQEAAVDKCAALRPIKITWEGARAQQLYHFIGSQIEHPLRQIADDVLAQLFRKNRALRVEPVTKPSISSEDVSRGRSLVLTVHTDDNLNPAIVKFGPAERMQVEQQRYDKYVHKRIGPFYAETKDNVLFWDIGATSYVFMATGRGKLPTFAAHFLNEQTSDASLIAPLEHFFIDVWGTYYKSVRPIGEPTLYDHYDRMLNLDPRLDELHNSPVEWPPPALPNLVNPLQWLLEHHHASTVKEACEVITHGDLHGDNLFVDTAGNAWAIDFERTGWGHRLRDFAEFEVDLVTRLTPLPSVASQAYYQFAQHLIDSRSLADPITFGDFQERSLTKTINAIGKLRSLAHQLTEVSDMNEYWWALLFDAIFVAAIAPPQRQKALLLAAALCTRLDEVIR